MKKIPYLALILFVLTYAAFAADTIKIGMMGPLTGQWASEGQEMKQVLQLLTEKVNSTGGVQGKKVDLLIEDDAGDPRTAALAAERLVSKGVVAVIGTYGSSITEASQGIYNESQVVQIADGSTAVRLTEKKLKYFFRTCPRDDEQAKVAAAQIKKMGVTKIAILHDNTTYAKGLAEETKSALQKMGGIQVVFFDAITPGEHDYSTVLTKMKLAQPQVVFFTGYYSDGGLLLRQKKAMGWNVPFIGGDAMNNPELVKIAGPAAASGFYFTSTPLPKDLPTAKGFLDEYKKKYGQAPNSIYAVLSGDGFNVAIAGLKAIKTDNSVKLAEYLHNGLKDYPGLSGKLSFNAKGDRVGEVYRVYKVDQKGNFILQ